MRAPRVCGGEGGIVAANFAGRLFRVSQEKQVVNGDDLRGAARRNEQRVRRVHDVEVAGQRFDRRPFGAVPEQVQHAHRNASIDDRDAQIRPTAGDSRSFHELVKSVTSPGCAAA